MADKVVQGQIAEVCALQSNKVFAELELGIDTVGNILNRIDLDLLIGELKTTDRTSLA